LREVPTVDKEAPEVEEVQEKIKEDGERKYVTVMFSDLSGYTSMSEELDPEEVKEIMSRIWNICSSIHSPRR
jgi:class 3 adenylate cyclase